MQMDDLEAEGSMTYNAQLHHLSCLPQLHRCYSQCDVNGVRFVTWEQDRKLKTQNSGVMVESVDNNIYYGVLQEVVELVYPTGMSVIVFKCRWFNTETENMRFDNGLTSIDTSTSWYENSPFCLAKTARQVFYIDDPKAGDNNSSHWKVVISVSHRGIYNDSSTGRSYSHKDAYQEDTPMNTPQVSIDSIHVDDNVEVEDEGDNDDDDSGDNNIHGDDEMDVEDRFEDDVEDDEDDNDGGYQYEDDEGDKY